MLKSLFNSSPKFTFLFGLSLGVAILATVSFFVLLSQNKALKKEIIKNVNTEEKVIGEPVEKEEPQQKIATFDISEKDHIIGDFKAPVTIVEFSDFQCPFCSSFHLTMYQLLDEYAGKVRLVWRHFPLRSIHPYAQEAALASECAGEQEKFWEFADSLYEHQKEIGDEGLYEKIASGIGLDTKKFKDCLISGKYTDKVNQDYQEGITKGVQGTPGNFINGQYVPGALPIENLKEIVDSLL